MEQHIFLRNNMKLFKSNSISSKLRLNEKYNEYCDRNNISGKSVRFNFINKRIINSPAIKIIRYHQGSDQLCCCSQSNLHILCIIKFENGLSILVGSSCVRKYSNDDFNNEIKEYKRQLVIKDWLQDNCINCKRYGICFGHKKLDLKNYKIYSCCNRLRKIYRNRNGNITKKCYNCKYY